MNTQPSSSSIESLGFRYVPLEAILSGVLIRSDGNVDDLLFRASFEVELPLHAGVGSFGNRGGCSMM